MLELIENYIKNTCKYSYLCTFIYLFRLTENINKHKIFNY